MNITYVLGILNFACLLGWMVSVICLVSFPPVAGPIGNETRDFCKKLEGISRQGLIVTILGALIL